REWKVYMELIRIGTLELIRFDPVRFMMGKLDGDRHADMLESNREIVITKKFYMQTSPVTVGEYRKFLEDTQYDSNYCIDIWDGVWVKGPHFNEINGRGDDFPVVGISYIDAQNYIEWASQIYGCSFRLP